MIKENEMNCEMIKEYWINREIIKENEMNGEMIKEYWINCETIKFRWLTQRGWKKKIKMCAGRGQFHHRGNGQRGKKYWTGCCIGNNNKYVSNYWIPQWYSMVYGGNITKVNCIAYFFCLCFSLSLFLSDTNI